MRESDEVELFEIICGERDEGTNENRVLWRKG